MKRGGYKLQVLLSSRYKCLRAEGEVFRKGNGEGEHAEVEKLELVI